MCQKYQPPKDYQPNMSNPLLDMDYDLYLNQLEGPNRVIAPFLACGDLSGYDSDKTYKLQVCSYYFLDLYEPVTENNRPWCISYRKITGRFEIE